MANLYLISTPIGNLKDITLRALETINSVEVLLCEDTRDGKLLIESYPDFISDSPTLLSYNDHNRNRRIPEVINLLTQGKSIGLITDRGTPLLSDPGYKLVQAVIELQSTFEDTQIIPVPGANALLPALQLSSFPPDSFTFVGFLPRKEGKLRKLLQAHEDITMIAYESPHRLVKSLEIMKDELGEGISVSISFEITKIFERTYRGTVSEVLDQLSSKPPKGECVLTWYM